MTPSIIKNKKKFIYKALLEVKNIKTIPNIIILLSNKENTDLDIIICAK